MKKILTFSLGIELSQKCNLDCKHCFRGEAHNVSITREILEKVFEEVKYIEVLDLSGGEIFLCYDELKLLLEIIKEKEVVIDYCSMLINGTIYDQRIYDLLDEHFGDNYQVAISGDDFHDQSIIRKYGNKVGTSTNRELYPLTSEDVFNNMLKHMMNKHCLGERRVSKHLINNGRAKEIDTPKKAYEILGYYYSLIGSEGMMVGPSIFIGADGYISDINSEIDKRNMDSLGNIMDINISDAVIKGGIKLDIEKPNLFLKQMHKREEEFALHEGNHLVFENNKMAYTTYTPDYKYNEAIEKLPEDLIAFQKAIEIGDLDSFFETWDPIYDGDLSQIDHKY